MRAKRKALAALALALLLCACGSEPAAPERSPEAQAPVPSLTAEEPGATEAPREMQTESESTVEEEEKEMLCLKIGETPVTVAWEENESVRALRDLCREGELTIPLSMYGGFVQVGPIGQSLPRSDVQIRTEAGDLVLYAGNQIVVFYGSNSWAYTRLGHITDRSAEELTALLGSGDVTISLWMTKA